MNDFEKSAKDAGYRAALRGESMYQYEQQYEQQYGSKDSRWMAFKYGYTLGEKELLKEKETQKDGRRES